MVPVATWLPVFVEQSRRVGSLSCSLPRVTSLVEESPFGGRSARLPSCCSSTGRTCLDHPCVETIFTEIVSVIGFEHF
jgi:hypothetical protein